MCTKLIAIIFTIIALAIAVLVSVWHAEALKYIVYISRFFDVMIPILAVGALLKYLWGGVCNCGCCQKKD